MKNQTDNKAQIKGDCWTLHEEEVLARKSFSSSFTANAKPTPPIFDSFLRTKQK
jgi:hypothetical protein